MKHAGGAPGAYAPGSSPAQAGGGKRASTGSREGILRWLAGAATRTDADGADLFGQLCERLCRDGVPLWRAALQLENLHPLYYGYCLHWYAGEAAHEVARTHDFAHSDAFRQSPYMASLNAPGLSYRRRLDDPQATPDLPLLAELKGRGATDFLAEVIPTGASFPPGVSWATQRPGGFSDADIALLRDLTPFLGLTFGAIAEHRKTDAVLRTYLGAGPGGEVMHGRTRRGDIRRLEAAVLLTDLRGFTAKTGAWSETELLDGLNGYFEAVADAVTGFRGEVLKFMGDGVLSMFPIAEEAETERRCRDAAAAVDAARRHLDGVNRRRADLGREELDFVAVLHRGSLSYGNIGARERLDFTVVGPAVNVASRVEPLAKALGERTLATASVARYLVQETPRSVGSHTLRGVADPVELFAI